MKRRPPKKRARKFRLFIVPRIERQIYGAAFEFAQLVVMLLGRATLAELRELRTGARR